MAEEIALALLGKVTKAAVKREQKVVHWREKGVGIEWIYIDMVCADIRSFFF